MANTSLCKEISKLNCFSLSEYLAEMGVDTTTITSLQSSQIDGNCFITLKEDQIKGLCLTARQTLHLQQILEKVRRTTVMNPLFIVPLNEKPKTSEKQVTYASNDMHYMKNWLKDHTPSPTNDTQIREFMEKTFNFRRFQIRTILRNATRIIQNYPRFIDFQLGSLITSEFLLIFPNLKQKFHSNFLNDYLLALIAYAKQEDRDFECPNDVLKALMLLLTTHPAIRKNRRISHKKIMERFIVFKKENEDLKNFISDKPSHLKQPFLVCIGTIIEPGAFYLVVDQYSIFCGNDVYNAFRNLYASFYTFFVEYPSFIRPFYEFFDEIIFQLENNEISDTNLEFVQKLSNIEVSSK